MYLIRLSFFLTSRSHHQGGSQPTGAECDEGGLSGGGFLILCISLLPDISLKIYSGRCSTARRSGGKRGIVRLRFASFVLFFFSRCFHTFHML